ncbi:MAG TPA: Lsr2 family protein [Propionibacteriaceae bacterium]|jgi:hypothetical protein
MTQKTIVTLIDDLDNRELNGDGQTIRFGLQSSEYEIDLGAHNVEKLHEALAPFIAAGRRVDNSPRNRSSRRPDLAEVRAMRQWGREHGMDVHARGRVPKNVQDAYYAAR